MLSKENKILNFIGLACRARKVTTGQTIFESFKKGKVRYLFIANDCSENSRNRYLNKCEYYKVGFNDQFSSEELSIAVGQNNRMAIGITDIGFAKKLKEMIEKGG